MRWLIVFFLWLSLAYAAPPTPLTTMKAGPEVVSSGSASVTLDANATADANGDDNGTITNSNLTIGSGANRCLVAQLNFYSTIPTGVAVTWNGVSMTQIGTVGTAFLFGLINPASGNHDLVATWTGGTLYVALNGTSFTGCDQTTPFINVSTSIASPNTVTNPSGNIAVDSEASNNTPGSPTQTQLYIDTVNSYTGASYSTGVNPTFNWNFLAYDVGVSIAP